MSEMKLTLEPELEVPSGIPSLTLDGVTEEKPEERSRSRRFRMNRY